MTVADSPLTITGCGPDTGGGILNTGTMTVAGSSIADGSGLGGILNTKPTMTVTDCTIADGSGGAIENPGTMTVTGSTIAVTAPGSGHRQHGYGSMTIADSTVANNTERQQIENRTAYESTLTVTNSTIDYNSVYSGLAAVVYTSAPAQPPWTIRSSR